MTPRRRAALACALSGALAWGVASAPFWLPRLLDGTPFAVRGTGAAGALWAAGLLAFALGSLALGVLAVASPASSRWGPRDAATMLLAAAGALPGLLLVAGLLLLGAANLDA